MSQEIFQALQGIETEANAFVAQAQVKAEEIRQSGDAEVMKIQEVAQRRIEGMRQNLQREADSEMSRLREDAEAKLTAAKQVIAQQAESHYPEALTAVVKECLQHGHR